MTKIIKLPKEIFSGVTTSIFVFVVGTPQRKQEIFTCYMAEDGLETIKNQGRQDIRGRWEAIEKKWVDIVRKQSGSDTIQWIHPDEHLSYQEKITVPLPTRADFMMRTLSYALFKQEIEEAPFFENVSANRLYGSPLKDEYQHILTPSEKQELPLNTEKWKPFGTRKPLSVGSSARCPLQSAAVQ